jgi:shikimate dehydrogenase
MHEALYNATMLLKEQPDLASGFIPRFLSAELPARPQMVSGIALAAIGTLADSRGASLRASMRTAGLPVEWRGRFRDPASLVADPTWSIAIVLSPFKRACMQLCDHVAPAARRSRVIDTILRTADGTLGMNTNAYAAAEALRLLAGSESVDRVLVAGTGAAARSLGYAAHLLYPNCQLGYVGRSAAAAQAVVEDIGMGQVVTDAGAFRPDVVVNATTVGETPGDRGSLVFDLTDAFRSGVRFLDLNQHSDALYADALAAGCVVMLGRLMQEVTHALVAGILVSLLH